jgi:hypothetical protein
VKLKNGEGHIVVQVGADIRQYRDSNNAIAWLNQVDRQSGLAKARRVSVSFPASLGSGWCVGTARYAIDKIRDRVDKKGGA